MHEVARFSSRGGVTAGARLQLRKGRPGSQRNGHKFSQLRKAGRRAERESLLPSKRVCYASGLQGQSSAAAKHAK